MRSAATYRMALICALASFLASFAVAHGAEVPVRRWAPSADPSAFDTEADNTYVNESLTLAPSATALVMVDLWDDELADPDALA